MSAILMRGIHYVFPFLSKKSAAFYYDLFQVSRPGPFKPRPNVVPHRERFLKASYFQDDLVVKQVDRSIHLEKLVASAITSDLKLSLNSNHGMVKEELHSSFVMVLLEVRELSADDAMTWCLQMLVNLATSLGPVSLCSKEYILRSLKPIVFMYLVSFSEEGRQFRHMVGMVLEFFNSN